MPFLPSDNDRALWHAWHAGASQPAINTALRDLYARLDADIARRSPTCWASGRCCHFESFGHRLYVTGLEIAWFLQQLPAEQASASTTEMEKARSKGLSLPQWQEVALPPACRYQIEGKCSTHAVRPLGCRIFFCQAGTEQWQNELYEQYLEQLRSLHERESLPYRYMEWRAGLIEADAVLSTER